LASTFQAGRAAPASQSTAQFPQSGHHDEITAEFRDLEMRTATPAVTAKASHEKIETHLPAAKTRGAYSIRR
jgi:hypothetical protein